MGFKLFNRLLDSLMVACGVSRVQSPVKDRFIPKTLKMIPVFHLFSTQQLKGTHSLFLKQQIIAIKSSLRAVWKIDFETNKTINEYWLDYVIRSEIHNTRDEWSLTVLFIAGDKTTLNTVILSCNICYVLLNILRLSYDSTKRLCFELYLQAVISNGEK